MKKIVSLVVAALVMCSCADSFLSEEPVGEFMPEQVESEENIEGIVIGAYWMDIMLRMRSTPVVRIGSLGMSYLTMPIKGVEVPVTKTRFT
jgi:hypothetical protein